jgi:hypothetical protein
MFGGPHFEEPDVENDRDQCQVDVHGAVHDEPDGYARVYVALVLVDDSNRNLAYG